MVKRRIRIVEKIVAKTLSIKIKKLFSKYSGNEPIHNYLEEYSPYHIFQMFEEGKKLFSNLINPLMYKQALSEFVKYGSFIKFPTKHVYQWMGIIMRNTAIIYHITEIVGHIDCSPLNDFIKYYFGDNDNPEDAWNAYKKEKSEDDDYSAMTDFLDNRGFFKWSKLPDSSDAWSDFGLQPLLEICLEYNENKIFSHFNV